jgi:Putative MetA-pathway of phenol degradation
LPGLFANPGFCSERKTGKIPISLTPSQAGPCRHLNASLWRRGGWFACARANHGTHWEEAGMRLSIQGFGIVLGLAIACGDASAQGVEQVQWKSCGAPPCVAPQPICPQPLQPVPQAPVPSTPPTVPQTPPQATPPTAPQTPSQPTPEAAAETPSPFTDFEGARAGAGLGETFAMNPAMFGDQMGVMVNRVISVNGVTKTARIPFAARGAFKIADNESPRPTDRVFFNYNYFNALAIASTSSSVTTADLHRETIGFEKTFLDGNASFGMRVPFLQLEGDGSVRQSDIGDLTFIFKYAPINDRQTGNVLSTGLAVTVPTGPDNIPNVGTIGIHDTLLQPYVGYMWNSGDLFLQGFTSLVVPTDMRDVTFLFNDVGVGYWVRRNRTESFINSIIPTVEVHVTTPLNHRGINNIPVGASDEVEITTGVHMLMGRHADLGIAVGEPVTGPRPYTIEAFGNLTFRF